MADGEHLTDAGTDAVEDAVGGDKDFADVGAADFRDHAAQTGTAGKAVRGVEETLPPPGGDG